MKYAILAAGEGSRLAGEGINVPKPLVEICGERMIDRLIRIFLNVGAEEVIVITNDLAPQTQTHIRELQLSIPQLRLVVKTTPSSMHSFYELAPLLGVGRFCLTTVDTIFREQEFRDFIEAFSSAPADIDGMMAVTDFVDDEKPLWITTDVSLRITGFYDTREHCRYISGGIYALSDKSFVTLNRCMAGGQSRMRNFQRALVADGMNLRAWPFTKILDVDHADDIIKAEEFISKD